MRTDEFVRRFARATKEDTHEERPGVEMPPLLVLARGGMPVAAVLSGGVEWEVMVGIASFLRRASGIDGVILVRDMRGFQGKLSCSKEEILSALRAGESLDPFTTGMKEETVLAGFWVDGEEKGLFLLPYVCQGEKKNLIWEEGRDLKVEAGSDVSDTLGSLQEVLGEDPVLEIDPYVEEAGAKLGFRTRRTQYRSGMAGSLILLARLGHIVWDFASPLTCYGVGKEEGESPQEIPHG